MFPCPKFRKASTLMTATHPGRSVCDRRGAVILSFRFPSPFYSVWDPRPHNSHPQLGCVFQLIEKFFCRHAQGLVTEARIETVTLAIGTDHHPVCPSLALCDENPNSGATRAPNVYFESQSRTPYSSLSAPWAAGICTFAHSFTFSNFNLLGFPQF